MKVVINEEYPSFIVSDEAMKWLEENKGWKISSMNEDGHPKDGDAEVIKIKELPNKEFLHSPFIDEVDLRVNEDLIDCVEEIGGRKSAHKGKFKVVEIPDGIKFYVEKEGTKEAIHEEHRVWF